MESKFICASALILKSYHAVIVDLRLAPKLRGVQTLLGSYFKYIPRLTAGNDRHHLQSCMRSNVKRYVVECKERREGIACHEERRRGDVSDRHATDFSVERGSAGYLAFKGEN